MSRHSSGLLWRVAAVLALALAAGGSANGATLDEAYLAVVQLPSHGASGTIIATAPGETLILTVAHAFEGPLRTRPVTVLVPSPEGSGRDQQVGIRLAAIDERADLALVVMNVGPLAHAARVAGRGAPGLPAWAYSCGYDGMRLPAAWALTRVRGGDGPTTFTEQRPEHGRSGGALFDARTGQLVGVVQGYTLTRTPVGVYASLESIHTFLERSGYGRAIGPADQSSLPASAGLGATAPRVDPAPARSRPD